MTYSIIDDDRLSDEVKANMILLLLKVEKCSTLEHLKSILDGLLKLIEAVKPLDTNEPVRA